MPLPVQQASLSKRLTSSRSLRARFFRLFAVQVVIISLATLLGIFVTNSIVQDILARTALDGEADHFWTLYRANPATQVPDTDNMRGYLAPAGKPIPEELVPLQPGYYRVTIAGEDQIVHVSERERQRLYLVFDSGGVSDLAFYFGILPLSIVLLLIYALMLIGYRLSQRAISPIVRLARYLEEFDFNSLARARPNLTELRSDADPEVTAMLDALDHFTARLDAFVERERVFTRDASHELRTPIAVFKGTLDLLEKDSGRPPHDQRALQRMRRTVADMEGLLETLLLLVREEALELPSSDVLLNELLDELVDQLRPLAEENGNQLTLDEQGSLRLAAPASVLQILFANLVRNAINYTRDGSVIVVVTHTSVQVVDTGVGMTPAELEHVFEPFYRADGSRQLASGHGLGLAIVRRLVRQFGWTLTVQSKVDEGTNITVRLINADSPH